VKKLFWEEELETAPRGKIADLQLERLKKLIDYCYSNVPFYKKKLDDAGIKGEHIKNLEDIESAVYGERGFQG